jgi:PAS domain S-box-containing protein
MQNDGVIVARSPDESRFVGRTIAGGELDRRVASQGAEGSLRIKGVLYGRDLFMSYQRVAATPYVINVAFDASQVLSPWYRLAVLYGVLGFALLSAIALSIWAVRQDQLRRVKMMTAQQVQDIIEGMSTQVALVDAGGRVIEVNRAFLVSGGIARADVIGRPLWDAFWYAHSSESQKHVRFAIERATGGQITRGDFVVRTASNAFSTVDTTFQPVYESAGGAMRVIVSGVDVTERRQIEQQLAQSQKLEAIGLLAGGIAHDFNNLLSAIANFAGFLVEDLKAQPSEQSYATRISKACEHGKQVVKQLLAYARPAAEACMALDLRVVLAEMEMLVRSSLNPATILRVAAGADAVLVRADQAQLVQVLVNLCLNARDALPGQEGTVRVELSTAHWSDPSHPAHAFAMSSHPDWAVRRAGRTDPSKSYALIIVTDDGDGMDLQTLKHVFDPFFTTKPSGHGTGLGLPIVDSIILSLDGAYKVETRRGHGTRFSIYLPLDEAGARAPLPPAPHHASKPARKIRILFVDDDFMLADAMALAMTRHECEAVAVDDPAEALAAIDEDPGAWDVIVTDEHMPEMNGTDLIVNVKARYPDLPIILCTGSDTVSEAIARRKGAAAFFRKPVEPARLAEAIRAAFEAARKARVT